MLKQGELAYFDHYSIHPRAVEPLEPLHVPIHVVSGRKEGTVETIINTETFISENIVRRGSTFRRCCFVETGWCGSWFETRYFGESNLHFT